jgi:hypothetical protein
MGLEPTLSAVRMRLEKFATVLLDPKYAANPHFWWPTRDRWFAQSRWLPPGLVSRPDHSPKVGRAIDAGVALDRGEHANLEQLDRCRTVISCRSSFGAGLMGQDWPRWGHRANNGDYLNVGKREVEGE